MVEVTGQLNSVRRTVGARQFDTGEVRTVTLRLSYDAEVSDVWDACTNPERIPRWFLPISGELRVGGHYQLEGNAGGSVEECEPPHRFAATWEFGGTVSWIRLELSADPAGGTVFELEHIGCADDERWAEFGPGQVGVGWDMALKALTEHLVSGAAIDPKDGAAWMVSPEGREFMTLSSVRWGEASIAAGTDPAQAKAAADRTTAAYTAFQVEA